MTEPTYKEIKIVAMAIHESINTARIHNKLNAPWEAMIPEAKAAIAAMRRKETTPQMQEKMSWYLMNEGAKLGLMGDVPHEFFWNALKEWERINGNSYRIGVPDSRNIEPSPPK